MSRQWHYSEEGAQYGPVDEAEIIQLIQSGELPAGTPVCKEGGTDWQPAREHACFQVEIYPKKKKAPIKAAAATTPKTVPARATQSRGATTAKPAATAPSATTSVPQRKLAFAWVVAGILGVTTLYFAFNPAPRVENFARSPQTSYAPPVNPATRPPTPPQKTIVPPTLVVIPVTPPPQPVKPQIKPTPTRPVKTKPTPRPINPIKATKPPRKKKHVIKIANNTQTSKGTTSRPPKTQPKVAQPAVSIGERNNIRKMRNQLSAAIKVNVPGANRAAFTSYASYVVAVYRRTWEPLIPANLARPRVAEVSVTIRRDGRVLSARIIRPTGDAALDRSVQRALDRVRTIGKSFPSGSRDPQRTFTLDFTPQIRGGP